MTRCAWCGLEGHSIGYCSVRADRRTKPDQHDEAAALIVDQLTNRKGRRQWISAVEARRIIARELRARP